MGFWMFTNQQIFRNVVIPITYFSDRVQMGHHIIESIFSINPGTPFLGLFVFMVFCRLSDYTGLDKYILPAKT